MRSPVTAISVVATPPETMSSSPTFLITRSAGAAPRPCPIARAMNALSVMTAPPVRHGLARIALTQHSSAAELLQLFQRRRARGSVDAGWALVPGEGDERGLGRAIAALAGFRSAGRLHRRGDRVAGAGREDHLLQDAAKRERVLK